ncbi:hypothetical protein AAG747_14160 [Rapidithrix thailandica]|uniref:Glycoside hydrolase n=1 Tax=Rapidithrix thailandica TaxID=413964 RepID=A0AAW9S9M7_9BACT
MRIVLGVLTLVLIGGASWVFLSDKESDFPVEKMNGVSLVAPPKPFEGDVFQPIVGVSANWVAIIPYAFINGNSTGVSFDQERQWWGERTEGVLESIRLAKEKGLRVMLKPHVWVKGQGWAGDFALHSEKEWKAWERNYTRYILHHARLADSLHVELFCIGTEFRKAVVQREVFWNVLIERVREVYTGELTYAANWDNYEQIMFWPQLDYIGLDAYFPLSMNASPSVKELKKAWEKPLMAISQLQKEVGKPVLFTEYGYRSIDQATGKQWELPTTRGRRQKTIQVNLQAQKNAYQALYEVFWSNTWFAGGFLWKWYSQHQKSGGEHCSDYTPQNKPAETIIRRYYSKSQEVHER